MSSDPIGDMLTVLRNANAKFIERVDIPSSCVKKEIGRVLKDEGYVVDCKQLADRKQGVLRISLKYLPNKTRALQGIKRVSRPGLRVYRRWDALPRVRGGLGMSLVSTSKGIMSDLQARKQKMGGEVLALVW